MSDVTDKHASTNLEQHPTGYCAECGTELDADSQFCQRCGARVEAAGSGRGGAQRPADPHAPSAAERGAVANTEVLGRRVGATIIDWIVGGIGAVLIGSIVGFVLASIAGSTEVVSAVLFLVAIPVYFLYYILLEANGGQTLGKKVLGIKVVKTDGSDITLGDSLVRNALRLVDGVFSYLLGFVIILASSDNQRFGDVAANTLVVRTA